MISYVNSSCFEIIMKKEIKNEAACYIIYFITQNGESRSTNEQNKSRYGDTGSSATVNSLKVSFTR